MANFALSCRADAIHGTHDEQGAAITCDQDLKLKLTKLHRVCMDPAWDKLLLRLSITGGLDGEPVSAYQD